MIPKIIHYCWFGQKDKPEDVLNAISSWKKFCPDYQLKEWNESNFDIHFSPYVEEAYKNKKWAFVSDVARLYALSMEGGIYMDTDMQVLKSFDALTDTEFLIGKAPYGKTGTGFIGCENC